MKSSMLFHRHFHSALAGFMLSAASLASNAAVVPVTGITGHDGGNWPTTAGHLTDMVNALNPSLIPTSPTATSGMDTTNPDPANWTWTSGSYQQTWHANSVLAGTSSGKIGWVVMDFGGVVNDLENAYLWASATNQTDGGKEQVRNYKIWSSNGVGINTLPAMPNSKGTTGDYDFTVGDWTQIGGTHTLGQIHGAVSNIIPLGGISARYIGIEVMSIYGVDTRMAIAQVEINQTTADTDPPTLAPSAIVDDQSGGPVDVSTPVTYTLTFSEDMNAGTVTAADFENAGTSAISIGAIHETSPGVFTVKITPTTVGTLRLRIPVSASITDVAGNPLNNNPAILDDTTLTVNADGTAPTLAPANIVDDRNGGPIAMNSTVIYTLTFSEDINSSTVSAADFTNAGTSNINIGAINETSPGVFTILVTPTDEGTLRLQIPAGATIADTAGNPLANGAAILDDTTITVQTSAPSALVEIAAITGSHGGDSFANGMVSLTNGSGINKVNPNDPSTWTMNGSLYPDEWMATYLKAGANVTPGLNAKVAWASLDFGSKTPLGMVYLFNTNYSGGLSSTDQFNIYYADSPAVALPAQPAKGTYATTGLTPQADYNFSGGGWTLFNTAGPLTATKAGISSFNLPGVSARYLAIEILSNQGDSSSGGRVGFDEIAVTVAPTDSDNDGMPDDFEFAHTDPPSVTALNPGDDLENSGAGDGLSNLQEYQLGTDPLLADTDGDGLEDGPEVAGAGSRPRTDPLKSDSDDDGLSDLVETNTGVWVDASNTGTSPVNLDTDADGLKDGVETNTGTFVSIADTGTNPHNPNSDGDNASDWYEVVIIDTNPALGNPPNSPNDPALKPNMAYPRPDPDTSTGVTNKPVKVYIMSGQSNMVGFGQINGTGPGTLQRMTTKENKFPNLVGPDGAWTTRNDVRYRGVVSDFGDGPLRADVADDSFGPELGFGYVMGDYHEEPVLLIKSSVGNRSLLWDYAAPTTPAYVNALDGKTYAGYGQAPNSWDTLTGQPYPYPWYAGKQFDDCFKNESDMSQLTWQIGVTYQALGNIGSQVRHNGVEYVCKATHTATAATEPGVGADWATTWNTFSITNAWDVLDRFATDYEGPGKPYAQGQGFEIAGFVWWQGYSDRGEPAATLYRENMARFITQLRAYYESRFPGKGAGNAPFVLATLATNGGWSNTIEVDMKVAQAQLDIVNDVPNVKTMEARGFWRETSESPGTQGFHYNWNAETYLLAGDALGRAMIDLQGNVTPPGSAFGTWADTYPGLTTRTSSLDFDGGGLDTGIEWVVGGNPSVGTDDAGLAPTIERSNPDGKLRFIFRRTTAAKNDANTTIAAQYGSSLAGWTNAVHQGTGPTQITITEETNGFGAGTDRVTVALPANLAGAAGKLFVRLNVTVAGQ